jgi:membrane protein
VLITIGLALFIVISFTLVVTGPEIADWLATRFGLGSTFAAAWKILQWPVIFLLVSTGMGIIYYFAPDAEQEWAWITPGSVLAATLWLLGSLVFRVYVQNFTNYEATYGAIGGMALLLLWFYLSGLVIVIGAEMNAEIEHAAPWSASKAFAAVPGKKKKIGLAAWRAYDRLHAARPAS